MAFVSSKIIAVFSSPKESNPKSIIQKSPKTPFESTWTHMEFLMNEKCPIDLHMTQTPYD